MLLHTLLFNKPHQQRKDLSQGNHDYQRKTSIPRLELIAAVIVANLAENIANSLQRFKVTAVHGWSDSMVVLHWLKGKWYLQTIRTELNRSHEFKSLNSVALYQ